MATEAGFCQKQHKTDRPTPDSRQTQTPPDSTIGATIETFAFFFLLPELPPSELNSNFFRIARTAHSPNVTDTGYYKEYMN
jgi:hypothetical protein